MNASTESKALREALLSELQDYYDKVIINPSVIVDDELIDQCFSEIVDEFMLVNFGGDFSDTFFYTDIACDLRCDFERESRDFHQAEQEETTT